MVKQTRVRSLCKRRVIVRVMAVLRLGVSRLNEYKAIQPKRKVCQCFHSLVVYIYNEAATLHQHTHCCPECESTRVLVVLCHKWFRIRIVITAVAFTSYQT